MSNLNWVVLWHIFCALNLHLHVYLKRQCQMCSGCFQLIEIGKPVSFYWVIWASVWLLTTCVETRISSAFWALHVKCSSIFWRIHPKQTRKQMWKCLLADFITLFIFFLFLCSLKETRVSQAANELSLFLLKMRISDARYPISMQRFIFPRTSMRAVSKKNMRNYRAGERVFRVLSRAHSRSKWETVSVTTDTRVCVS